MLEIISTFAGVTSKNKSIVTSSDSLYYLSSSNLVLCDKYSIVEVFHFENTLNCLSVLNGKVLIGDIAGKVTILTGKTTITTECGSKIQDCCFLDDQTAIFCTFKEVSVFNFTTMDKFSIQTQYMISSVTSVDSKILIGTNTGILYFYSIKDNQILEIQKIDAHLDCIKDIQACDGLIATCSQDSNVKIWKMSEEGISLIQTLNGHSDWVNSLCWNDGKLYSASSDKTVRVWEKNSSYNPATVSSQNAFYICSNIIGESSELLGVAFIDDRMIVQTKTGGIDKQNECEYFMSGHLAEIADLDWNKNLLLTCSSDRTTRLFYKGKECARPQIHGFPMTSAKFLPSKSLRYISSAQETILRVFEATQFFFSNCEEIQDTCLVEDVEDCDFTDFYPNDGRYVESAYLAELNLTNEILQEHDHEILSENSLSTNVFRECQKIYGHYFEIKNIAVGKEIILSCNRSAVKRFAGLFVWDMDGIKQSYIEVHDLGIQRIAISSNQQLALTAGRDQVVCLYSIDGMNVSVLKKFNEHSRIVWDCRFSADSLMFATCSRDGTVIIYDSIKQESVKSIEFDCEITSIDFNPKNNSLIAGNNLGEILCFGIDFTIVSRMKVASQKINILRFDETGTRIAVGGSDGLLRILKYDLL